MATRRLVVIATGLVVAGFVGGTVWGKTASSPASTPYQPTKLEWAELWFAAHCSADSGGVSTSFYANKDKSGLTVLYTYAFEGKEERETLQFVAANARENVAGCRELFFHRYPSWKWLKIEPVTNALDLEALDKSADNDDAKTAPKHD